MNRYLIKMIIMALACVGFGLAMADDLPQPEFIQTNFLGVDGILEMNADKALILTDSLAGLFVHPSDAVVLHVDVGEEEKDVFIFSDDAMRRLTIWMTKRESGPNKRTVEAIKEYLADETGIPVNMPRGLATNAVNRKYDPTKDVIYLADMGNNRILELVYVPDMEGGKLTCNRIIAESEVHYPTDIAISAYGDGSQAKADLYITEAGTFNDDGALSRYNLNGICEGRWQKINFYNSSNWAVEIHRPISVACYPDTAEGLCQIYVSDEYDNMLHFFMSETDADPFYTGDVTLEIPMYNSQAGGIGIDDYGRVYIANSITGRFEIFGSELMRFYDPYGNNASNPERFVGPTNIIFDTYYQQCEAIVLEWYDRQSGIQTYIVKDGYSPEKPPTGFIGGGLLKPDLQRLASLPSGFKLGDAYPNPFNATCVIKYELPTQSHVRIDIFNVLGQRVTTLVDEQREAGVHQTTFDATDLASGIYLYRISTDTFCEVKKAVLLK